MNNTVKKIFEKIFLDKNLIKEFSELKGHEIFDFLKKHSDSDFTKQEFEDSIIEIFETLYGQGIDLKKLSPEDLDAIAGGKGHLKKGIALTMAMLSLGSGIPFIPGNLDFTPKTSAFWRNKNFRIRRPFEIDRLKEHLRIDNYYRPKLRAYGAPIDDAEAFRDWWGGPGGNGETWWRLEDPTVAESARANNAENELGQLGRVFGIPTEIAQNIRQHVGQVINNIGNNGSNIMGNHAPESQRANILDIINDMDHGRQNGQTADVIPELAAADRLLLCYFDCVARENGISTNGLNNDVLALMGTDSFKTMIDEHFGTFNIVDQPTGPFGMPTGGAQRRHVKGHDRLMKLIIQRGAEQRQFDREVFFSQMQRNAPALITSAILFSKMGTLMYAKNLIVQAGMWAKAGVIKAYNRFVYNRLTLERDPVKLKELMTEYLKSSVFRQDAAMDRISEIMSGMTDLWSASDSSGKPCTSACTMTFMGDSGIGKTYAARTLSKALFHQDMQPWQFITSTSVTASAVSTGSGSSENLSPADQLFNGNSEIVRQLKLNNRVIIVLDEVDKMHKSDPNDTILERLRDARDTGKLLVRNGVNYEYIDVSRTVFICITNELRECWGLPADDLTEAQAAARTNIKRDKSLVNRFDVIEFSYLKSEDYSFILRPELNEIKEEYYQKYGIDINISDELVEEIAHAAEVKNKGVRGVNDFLVLIRGKLVDYRSKHKDGNFTDKINFKYIPEANTFNID